MKKRPVYFGVLSALLATGGLSFQTAIAQDGDDEFIEEIVTTGTRSAKPRSASDSPVPIDVINSDDFNALGNTADLTDNIRALVPSYTATPATGDGSAFVRPAMLRGTAPDQTLVLVDGKGVADAALDGFHMFGMNGAIAGECLDLAPQLYAKSDDIGRVADTDLFLKPRRQVHQPDRPFEHQIHAFAEARFLYCIAVHRSPPGMISARSIKHA